MNVRSQISTVFHLDKCIGCHTCSVACKNIWTDRRGTETMWWNNVETRPGTGYPTRWEDQKKYRGGWEVAGKGRARRLRLRLQDRLRAMGNLFFNPAMPGMDDYYEPWTYRYGDLFTAPQGDDQPTARPVSLVDGRLMEIEAGPNWDDDLGGSPVYAANDPLLESMSEAERQQLFAIERLVYFYVPRICNHCLNPACLAACPSGAIYKRGEDGIVLVSQDRCRGWRMCISGCPYKKVYYNWAAGKSEKCILCYPRQETGQAPACFHACVGRIRYLGVLLYDAEGIEQAAKVPDEELVSAQRAMILNPADPEVISAAQKSGVPEDVIRAAQRSPVYRYVREWNLALPLHPEYRTLPMVWYVPPLSPITAAANAGQVGTNGEIPDVTQLRIPVKYLANLLTAGDTAPVVRALERMLAMRAYQRAKHVDGETNLAALKQVNLTQAEVEEMYHVMAIANYEDRFVIPSTHREYAENAFSVRGGCGFSFGNGCSEGIGETSLFGSEKKRTIPIKAVV